MVKYGFSALAVLAGYALLALITGGCAQMGYPTGGPKDSLPPVLIKATPEINTVNFSGNKITLQFNEYIDIQNIQDNLLVSPYSGQPFSFAPGQKKSQCKRKFKNLSD